MASKNKTNLAIILVLVFISVLIFFAVGSSGFVWYENPNIDVQDNSYELKTRNGFDLNLPESWKDISGATGDVFFAINGDPDIVASFIKVDADLVKQIKLTYPTIDKEDLLDLETFVTKFYFQTNLQRASAKIKSEARIDFKNLEAREVYFSDNVKEIGNTENYSLFIKKDKAIYCIIFTASPENFDKYIDQVTGFVVSTMEVF